MKLPRLFGEFNDHDTQFMHALKKYQEIVFIGLCGVFILIIFSMTLTFTAGREGTWRYALCKVFLERYVDYPTSMKILTAGEKSNSAQIGYIATNAFGSRESELIECFYNIEQNGIRLNQVTIDRIPIDNTLINVFNPTIGTILAQENLDYKFPKDFPEDIADYKTE
jgi:hypothetical protein